MVRTVRFGCDQPFSDGYDPTYLCSTALGHVYDRPGRDDTLHAIRGIVKSTDLYRQSFPPLQFSFLRRRKDRRGV